jgi:hypothetical protein
VSGVAKSAAIIAWQDSSISPCCLSATLSEDRQYTSTDRYFAYHEAHSSLHITSALLKSALKEEEEERPIISSLFHHFS